ncbi:MAG TPA: VTT domain-containing protein [Candidatus Sulfotelmatobacter sp.]|nr:VTT domain-containing protein [Candidatus Sulfotelmatobacter sp.]
MELALGLGSARLWSWLLHRRSAAQIAIGVADNSVIPLPGSMDVFTVWLAASEPRYWLYYALMATIGSLVGGYITYFLARKGGKEALEKKFKKRKAQTIYRRFERWGVGAVAVPAMLPPPFPIVPFLLAAGALQFPPKRFLGALALGRGIRFIVIAWLGSKYGTAITHFFSRYYKPTLLILIGLSVLTGILAVVEYVRRKSDKASRA